MTKLYGLLVCLLTALATHAQQDSVRKYLDADLHFTTKKDVVYPAMAVRSGDHWLLYAVYPDTSVLLKVFFRDAALTVKDGPFTLYHPKRVVAQNGYFINNLANGHWQTFYPDGQVKDEGDIINNHLTGVWKGWYSNGLPMSSKTYVYNNPASSDAHVHENSPAQVRKVLDDFTLEGVLEGEVSTWYENGNPESVVSYHNDSLSGTCTWFRPNGKRSSKETYKAGKVTSLECYDEDGQYSGSTCSILKPPVFIHVLTAGDYIVNELHREKHRNITGYGEAQVSFVVTQKGTVEQVTVFESPDPNLSKLIIQVITKMSPWSPAVTHNRKIDYTIKLAVPYYGD